MRQNEFGRTPQDGSPAEPWKTGVAAQAARRRALALRAIGRRARFAILRRALPERLATVRFIFALRAGFAFFFAIFAIGILSFSFPGSVLPIDTNRNYSILVKVCDKS